MQRYVSPILYHMVGSGHANNDKRNFGVLCQILESMTLRCRSVGGKRGCTVSVDYRRVLEDGEPIVQSVVCVADIPPGDLGGIHASKYGRFGVGVDKALFARWGGRPVVYVPYDRHPGAGMNNVMAQEMLTVHQALRQYFDSDNDQGGKIRRVGERPTTPGDAVDLAMGILVRDVLAFIKYFDFALEDEHAKNFYMEREWRKFGDFGLHDSLREVVVPPEYVGRIRAMFPGLAATIVPL